jgi:hypothetical protein
MVEELPQVAFVSLAGVFGVSALVAQVTQPGVDGGFHVGVERQAGVL